MQDSSKHVEFSIVDITKRVMCEYIVTSIFVHGENMRTTDIKHEDTSSATEAISGDERQMNRDETRLGIAGIRRIVEIEKTMVPEIEQDKRLN